MDSTDELVTALGYADGPWWRTAGVGDASQAQTHRLALRAGAVGAYSVGSGQSAGATMFPAVYVARAHDEPAARRIWRQMWNLGSAPFLIVLLPSQMRVYSGFTYTRDRLGVLERADLSDSLNLSRIVEAFHRNEIDSGRIWASQSHHLDLSKRVDRHLLTNLKALGARLKGMDIDQRTGHALIGKYIYASYLRHRGILSAEWLQERGLSLEDVFGRYATAAALSRLVEGLEARFGGRVFPFMEGYTPPPDDVVRFVARTFAGVEVESEQIPLGFDVYDFSFIPVELLSAVYEQFLHAEEHDEDSGAIYTPEFLADYVISQVEAVRPLSEDMKVLDPCCGSGIFLVLSLRRMIEARLHARGESKLPPAELSAILTSSIYGVERNIDACFVTEFSLLLTILSYLEPPDLHLYPEFRFPDLHGYNVVHGDFFDPHTAPSLEEFDWVLGNPPWLELPKDSDQEHLLAWIQNHEGEKPVPRRRTGEAFAWRSAEILSSGGAAGLVLHATTLTNVQLAPFRRAFFEENRVELVTNFANFAYVLFADRADTPACVLVFTDGNAGTDIDHYGPFVAHQPTLRFQRKRGRRAWMIVVTEADSSRVPAEWAASGDNSVWKFAMWGGRRHRRNVERLQKMMPLTVGDLTRNHSLTLALGMQLRSESASEDVTPVPELEGIPSLDARALSRSKPFLQVPQAARGEPLPRSRCFVRKGRTSGVVLALAPHVIVGPLFAAFGEDDLVITHPKIAIAGTKESSDHLRALSLYLSSSVGQYLLFFLSARWGLERRDLLLSDVRELPAPALTMPLVGEWARAHRALVDRERQEQPQERLRALADEIVVDGLQIPEKSAMMAQEFIRMALPLDKGRVPPTARSAPSADALAAYGRRLETELSEFAGEEHHVHLRRLSGFVCCRITLNNMRGRSGLADTIGDDELRALLWPESQWVYVQRSLRIIEPGAIFIYKPALGMLWTETAALEDSDDIIAEVLG